MDNISKEQLLAEMMSNGWKWVDNLDKPGYVTILAPNGVMFLMSFESFTVMDLVKMLIQWGVMKK